METHNDLTPTERANLALIEYPRFRELHRMIRQCQEMSKIADEPQCMCLEGQPGAGKTKLVKTYAAHFPEVITETTKRVLVFYMEVPSPTGIKDVASAGLRAMGDQAYGKGTTSSMTTRLVGYLKDFKTELVILDDLHHLIDPDTDYVLNSVSEWLKYVIKEANVPVMGIGIEGRIRRILRANPQLSRLFVERQTLEPFAWDTGKPEAIQEFAQFIEYAEQAGKPLANDISRVDLLYRIHYVTRGTVGNIMKLMRYATKMADECGSSSITLDMLSAVFKRRLEEHVRTADPFAPDGNGQLPQQTTLPSPTVEQPEPRRGRGSRKKTSALQALRAR